MRNGLVVEIARCVNCVEEPLSKQFWILVASNFFVVHQPGQQRGEDHEDLALDGAFEDAPGASKGVSE